MVKSENNKMRIFLKQEVDESYDLIFGENLFPQIAEDLKHKPLGERYAIVTDSNVKRLYAKLLEDSLKKQGLDVATFSFEAGEQSKTIETAMKIIGEMSKSKLGRDSAILALGGGVVGDLAGFIASIFNRGIPYIQIPTTLLAQADSSIGGKTAVNTKYGKNLTGTFKQPERVYIDVSMFATLSDRDYSSGLAETIKHSIIQDADFFKYLEENLNKILKKDFESLLYIARNNCRIKGSVVEIDPHEKGLRRILNYGHTIGHAIEKLSVDKHEKGESKSYLSHGEAVSIGMMVAGRIAVALGHFPQNDLARQEKLLLAAGLPIKIPSEISDEGIIELTLIDKKAKNGQARYVLPVALGKMHDFGGVYAAYVDNKIVVNSLQQSR